MANMGLSGVGWRGRRVLLTGHTGFKGAWLRVWLETLGAEVTGVSLPAEPGSVNEAIGWPSDSQSIIADVRDAAAIMALTAEARPELVLHLAAQAFVRAGYRDPVGTFTSNVLGTLHVLEAARAAGSVRAVVVVTSDKVYENDGAGRAFRESDPLGGEDPYSASKAATELAVRSWRAAHHSSDDPAVATARAGNVIGGGDIGQDRLVPDAIRSLREGRPLRLRHPEATRPWQFVLEPLYGYLLLAEALLDAPDRVPHAVNFGPLSTGISTGELVNLLFQRWGQGTWQPDAGPHPPEATALRIDPSLAGETLGWHPLLGTTEAIELTVDWHRAQRDGRDLRSLMATQIKAYADRLTGERGVA